MASIINAATSGGLVTSADTSGVLQLQTASITAVTVDASQRLGIGTTSPAVKLDVVGASTTGLRLRSSSGASNGFNLYNDSTNDIAYLTNFYNGPMVFGTNNTERMRLDGSGNLGIGTSSPAVKLDVRGTVRVNEDNAGTKVIQLRSNWAGVGPAVQTFTDDPILFVTNGTERMRVLNTGNILSLAGGAITATGTGITFPATQDASSNANTLDDYEEGTWTPDDTSGASLSFTVYNATYTKIGRLVEIQASIYYPSTASTADAQIGGLPFNSAAGLDNTGGICLSATNANLNFTGLINRNNNKFFLETLTGAAVSNLNMSSKYIKFFGWYYV